MKPQTEDTDSEMPPKIAWEGDHEETANVEACSSNADTHADVIPLSRKVIFSAPTMATLPFVAMWGLYGTKNYQAFGASLAIIALFTALARSLDVVSDPLCSFWTDTARCDWLPRWLRGRRKPFMFFGCFFYSSFLWLLLNPPYVDSHLLAMWFGVFYTLYFLANTMTTIPYDALAPELSADSGQRTGLFFVANLFDGIGTLIAMGLPIAMTSFATGAWSQRNEQICKTELGRAEQCFLGRSCGQFFTTGYAGAYVANQTLVAMLGDLTDRGFSADPLRDCTHWRSMRTANSSVIQPNSTPEQNDGFCDCVIDCSDGCEVANKRTGFMLVGTIFACWFTVTMVTAVCRVPEKPRARTLSPPMVPAIRNALQNRPFRILLPAWLCDAFVISILQSLVPYFVEAVVAPAYQTKEEHDRDCYKSSPSFVQDGQHWVGAAGRSDSASYDRWCDTDNVIAMCGFLALFTAILVLPVWNMIVKRLGKVRTWLLWTMTMAATNLLFIFVPRGGIYALWAASAVNGAPLGAKFLADSILADIIDYDEFRTGARSEATYFMFKSFLPKIVQIPASAVPIALLSSFSYVPPVGGKVQDQPVSVSIYMRCTVGLGFLVSVFAYFIKRQYPLHDDDVESIARGLREHKEGKWAQDPLTKAMHQPMAIDPAHQETAWLLDHFACCSAQHLIEVLPGPQTEECIHERLCRISCSVSRTTQLHLTAACAFLLAMLASSSGTMTLLSHDRLQFLPTLFVVFSGMGVAWTAYGALRKRAADRLADKVRKHPEVLVRAVKQILKHRAESTAQEELLRFSGGLVGSREPCSVEHETESVTERH